MITLLVSSKTMLRREVNFFLDYSKPRFEAEAKLLNESLCELDTNEIRKIMHISENLAKDTQEKIRNWDKEEGWPAWLLFSGDVYKGLVADTLSKGDFEWAQDRVWTLSGLYGIARPLDLIKPYRLEAGFKLLVGDKRNIYDFWGDRVAGEINDEIVINLSSEEYIKLIRRYYKGKIITPLFLQNRKKNGWSEVKFEAVHAKVARGMMARWIIKNRIDEPDQLKGFEEDGYIFDVARSTELVPVFVRRAEGIMKIAK